MIITFRLYTSTVFETKGYLISLVMGRNRIETEIMVGWVTHFIIVTIHRHHSYFCPLALSIRSDALVVDDDASSVCDV